MGLVVDGEPTFGVAVDGFIDGRKVDRGKFGGGHGKRERGRWRRQQREQQQSEFQTIVERKGRGQEEGSEGGQEQQGGWRGGAETGKVEVAGESECSCVWVATCGGEKVVKVV
jgi:hypothetical protein